MTHTKTDTSRASGAVHELAEVRLRRERRVREDLIVRFHPLVYSMPVRYRDTGIPLDRLVAIASLGLVRAADRFDLGSPRPFGPYAVAMIEREIEAYALDLLIEPVADNRIEHREQQAEASQALIRRSVARQEHLRELADFLALDPGVLADGLIKAVAEDRIPLQLNLEDEVESADDFEHAAPPESETSTIWRLFRDSLERVNRSSRPAA